MNGIPEYNICYYKYFDNSMIYEENKLKYIYLLSENSYKYYRIQSIFETFFKYIVKYDLELHFIRYKNTIIPQKSICINKLRNIFKIDFNNICNLYICHFNMVIFMGTDCFLNYKKIRNLLKLSLLNFYNSNEIIKYNQKDINNIIYSLYCSIIKYYNFENTIILRII